MKKVVIITGASQASAPRRPAYRALDYRVSPRRVRSNRLPILTCSPWPATSLTRTAQRVIRETLARSGASTA